MIFKGEKLEIGDIVKIKTIKFLKTVVIDIEEGVLRTSKNYFNYFLPLSEVDDIEVIFPAKIAIWQESLNNFRQDEKVSFTKDQKIYRGKVVAAFGGTVVVVTESGRFIASGVEYLHRL